MATNKYLKAGIWYTVGNYLLKGLTFLTLPIFARLLTKADFGQYSIFTTYEMMLYVIIGFAMHSSYKNAYYRYRADTDADRSEYNSYVSTTLLLLLVNTGLWLIASILFNEQLGRILGLDGRCVPLLVIFSGSSALITSFNTDVSIRYEYGPFLAVSFINALGSIGLSLFLILCVFDNQRYFGRIIGCTVPYAIIASILFLYFLRKARPRDIKEKLRWGLKYSLPIIPHGLSQIVLNQFDRIMINRFLGSVLAGVYSFSYNLYMIIAVTATSVDNVWAPWLYERLGEKNYKAIKKVSSMYILFLLSFCIIISLASPELVHFFGGAKYKDSVYCVIPIVTSGFFAFAYNIPASVEYYHEKTVGIAAATFCAAVINIVLNYVFIKKYGYIAAAYTTLFTYFLYFYLHLFLSYKIENRMLFNIKVIVTASCVVLVNNMLAIKLVDALIVRMIIILAVVILLLAYEERKMGLIKRRLIKQSA